MNSFNTLMDKVRDDYQKRITVEYGLIKKFKDLYFNGVELVTELTDYKGVSIPKYTRIMYDIQVDSKPIELADSQGRARRATRMTRKAHYFDSIEPFPHNCEIEHSPGLFFLAPRNPIRSKQGVIASRIAIHTPLPIKDTWAGFDKVTLVQACELFTERRDPRNPMIVYQTPIDINFTTDIMAMVPPEWYQRRIAILWQEMSRIIGKCHTVINDSLDDKGVDQKEILKMYGQRDKEEFLDEVKGDADKADEDFNA